MKFNTVNNKERDLLLSVSYQCGDASGQPCFHQLHVLSTTHFHGGHLLCLAFGLCL